jgi:hypothetical protein
VVFIFILRKKVVNCIIIHPCHKGFIMKIIFSSFLVALFLILLVYSCKKGDSTPPPPTVDPCTGVTVTVGTSKVDAITGQTNGSITVTSPVGSGITYSVNNGTYQSSTNFNNLGTGTYSVTTKTAAGCTGTASVTITGYGPKYYLVRNIIMGYCGPCHLSGGVSGGVSFDTDANIIAKWDRIKARAVDNIPSVMPQGGPLTTADKQKITDWVNAGHTVNN